MSQVITPDFQIKHATLVDSNIMIRALTAALDSMAETGAAHKDRMVVAGLLIAAQDDRYKHFTVR